MNDKQKRKGKLLRGIIIGGAIGSVLGMTLAPQSGKETREIIKKKSGGLFSSFLRGMRALIKGKKEE